MFIKRCTQAVYLLFIVLIISTSCSKLYEGANRLFGEVRGHAKHDSSTEHRLNAIIDKAIMSFKNNVVSHFINESEICPYHPYPYKLPTPLPNMLNTTFSFIDQVLLNISASQVTPPPGLMFSVIYGDEIIYAQGLGSKNLSQPGIPPNLDTIFKIGSITKLFPAVMTMQLYESGFIRSLDDPIQDYAPFSIKNPFSSTDRVTWRNILCQMSGLPRQAPCKHLFSCHN